MTRIQPLDFIPRIHRASPYKAPKHQQVPYQGSLQEFKRGSHPAQDGPQQQKRLEDRAADHGGTVGA